MPHIFLNSLFRAYSMHGRFNRKILKKRIVRDAHLRLENNIKTGLRNIGTENMLWIRYKMQWTIISRSIQNNKAVIYVRCLDADFLLRQARFASGSVQWDSSWNNWYCDRFWGGFLSYPCQYHFTAAPYLSVYYLGTYSGSAAGLSLKETPPLA
jgi:hypothetical protein